MIQTYIPPDLHPFFQEYNLATLDLTRDANLIIQRTLEFGTWDEVRWLFETYGALKLRSYLRQFGERGLHPVCFTYWRKLFHLRQWRHSPFPTAKGEVWNF